MDDIGSAEIEKADQMTISDDELRRALTQIDILLKRRQTFWETPRNVAIILGVMAAIIGTIAGTLGFQLGSRPPPQINVRLDGNVHLNGSK